VVLLNELYLKCGIAQVTGSRIGIVFVIKVKIEMNKRNGKAATINDVARLSGVTNITVSRVFNTPEKVKPETRSLVMRMADYLHYVPNALAQGTKNNASRIIGIVTDDTFNAVYSYVINALCLISEKKGYSVMIFTTQGSRDSEAKALNTLVGYKAAGIVLSVVDDSPDYDTSHIRNIEKSSTRLIQFDREYDSQLPGVFIDNLQAGERVAEVINARGFTSLLIIGGKQSSRITRQRIAGITANIAAEVAVEVLYADYRYENARATIARHFAQQQRNYQCIVGINGPITLGAIGVASELNLKEQAFISIDAIPHAEDFNIFYPCVVHDYQQWAATVAENMMSAIEQQDYEARVFMPGKLKNFDWE